MPHVGLLIRDQRLWWADFAAVWRTVSPLDWSRTQSISEGVGGVVNELLVQMQSFDEPSGWQKFRTKLIDRLNLLLPMHRQLNRPEPPANEPAADRGDEPRRQP